MLSSLLTSILANALALACRLKEIYFEKKGELKMRNLKTVTSFDELLDLKYGKAGTKNRSEFEYKSKSFMIGELLKETRRSAKITQDALAQKAGTKKSYISRLENGKIDIQLSTLFRIFKNGLGIHINLTLS